MKPMPAVSTEDVWEQLSAKLRGFIRSRVKDDETAEDLLQETFLRIHQRLRTLGDDERLASWVYQIARNLIADHYRAPGRTKIAPADTKTADEPSSSERFNQNEVVAGWLPAAIDSLPEVYRAAVRMYELEGISQTEIADKLGLSLSGAKSRVQRGRDKLRQVLERCCAFDLDRRGNVLDWQPRREGSSCCDRKAPRLVALF